MKEIGQEPVKQEMETTIGNFLRAGVIAAASTVFLGGIIYLIRHGSAQAHYQVFQHGPEYLRNVQGILGNASTFHGRGLIHLGLLLLVATPITRVALSIFMFARKKDIPYVVITSIVFCILI